ncbi:MAG: serine hydrolase [Pirellula sp.]
MIAKRLLHVGAVSLLVFVWGIAFVDWTLASPQTETASNERPNIVVIFTDDQGYGDLGCFGSTTVRTPRLDSLAKDGTRFTSFYAQVVCGPSRSALLTGRYPNRSLGWSMPESEVTIAQLLQKNGYATACIGKWDVSNRAAILERMPNAKGFDYFWGTLGANDNGRVLLHENNQSLSETSDMASLTRLYTDKSIEFMKQNKKRPFFLYLAHTMVHSVIDASPEFRGKSQGGLFGDTIEELDFHSGRLLDAIDELGLRENTLVLFTTDNGPWNNFRQELEKKHAGQIAWGSSGPLREGKGSTYEGGLRVPCIARWPGKIPAGRVNSAIFATIDFLPTFAKLAGCSVPTDRRIDGVDQTELLFGKNDSGARNDYFYFCKNEVHGVRKGNYKLLLADRRQHYNYVKDKGSNQVELYDLSNDLGEKRNLAAELPDVVRELSQHATSIPFPDAGPDDRIASNPNLAKAAIAKDGTQLIVGDWAEHGFSTAKRDEIRAAFQNGIDNKTIPGGSMMIIHRGEVVLRESFGVADLGSSRPFLVGSPCQIASLTKPHTATLMAILAEKGKLKLDSTIDVYLPEFSKLRVQGQGYAKRSPTLRECLSHTAGFAGNDELRRRGPEPSRHETLGSAVAELAKEELLCEPGTKYDYSRGGYLVAGRVAEIVTGRTFQDLMRRYVLEGIGAEIATFTPSDEIQSQIPVQYDRSAQGIFPRIREAGPRFINPGGGLVSTLDDLGRFMLLHRNRGKVGNRQLIEANSLRELYVKQPATTGTGYGLGFNIVASRSDGTASRIRHTGASGTFAMLDFDSDFIVIILTQMDQTKILPWRNRLVQAIAELAPR